jgi:murein DD-endopeptidase MepM/ murein hydrolase activator NlpD
MGNHRADRRGSGRRPSDLPTPMGAPVTPVAAAGKRRAEKPAKADRLERAARPEKSRTSEKSPAKSPERPARVSRHAASRGALFRGLPSPPILLGVAALAISAGGAVTAANGGMDPESSRFSQASALSGASDVSRVNLLDRQTISRDSRRDALDDAADAHLVAQAEDQARQRDAALAKFAQQAEQQAAKLRLNQWVLPVSGYHLTAGFGEYSGLWSHYHTGLDFAAPSGTPIRAIANGVITSVSYDGAYGNKTVLTLDDGTELWFCHQTSYTVSEGQEVHAGDLIGYVGSTGHVTGPHLHLEVRPGAGDPVDPYEALTVHGLTP